MTEKERTYDWLILGEAKKSERNIQSTSKEKPMGSLVVSRQMCLDRPDNVLFLGAADLDLVCRAVLKEE